MKEPIAKLIDKKDLTKKEAQQTMTTIMKGEATPSQIAGFLVALRNKGETVPEIAGCALAMRDAAVPVVVNDSLIVDTCGTGGDGQNSLNVSTAAAFVVAGAGYTVAKHGNKSISSKCGSADVLQAMGVRVDGPSVLAEKSINEVGIGFMFAPSFHPAMKYAMPTRKELGIRTVFNMLGPLTNPAKAHVQLIGVFKPELTKILAQVLKQMGHKAGLVVHSKGWDEITLDAPTHVSELLNGKIRNYKLNPKDFGLPKVSPAKLKGKDAVYNGQEILEILQGKEVPARHVIVANAAALIWIAERAKGNKTFKLKDGVKKANESIESGSAYDKYKMLAEVTHSLD